MSKLVLKTAQRLFLEKAKKTRANGQKKGLLIFPTGLGKSVAAFSDAVRFKGKILVLAHNKDLLHQLANDFKKVDKTRKIGFMYSAQKDFDAEVIFANVQTMNRCLKRFKKDAFEYIIVDETHHVATKTYKNILNYFKPKFLLGMTATPNRTDAQDILSIYNKNIVLEITEDEAINRRWLRPFETIALWDKWCDYSRIKKHIGRNGEYKYDIKEVGKRYLVPERIKGIIKVLKNGIHKNDYSFDGIGTLKGVYFCVRRSVAKRYCEEFNKAGIRSAYLDNRMDTMRRTRILADFKKGDYQLLFNVDLIGEGFHIPHVDLVILDRPTGSFIKHIQQRGRQTFNIEGAQCKSRGLVLDLVGNSITHFLVYTHNIPTNRKYTCSELKELLERSIGQRCSFQPEVLENLTARFERVSHWSKQGVIDNYFKVQKELGRPPRLKETNIHHNIYVRLFGSWTKFLNALQEPIFRRINQTQQQLIDAYYKRREELGRQPTSKDMHPPYTPCLTTYVRVFGSWYNFLERIKEPLLCRKNNTFGRIKPWSRKELIEVYQRRENELGRQPTSKDMHKPGLGAYTRVFGSWINFRKEMSPHKALSNKQDWSQQELIDRYHEREKELGRPPRGYEMYAPHSKTYQRVFGSWNDFLDVIKVTPATRSDWTLEELKNRYHKRKKELGRQPKCIEVGIPSTVFAKLCGSWNGFLDKIGEPTIKRFDWTQKKLIDCYHLREKELGRQPRPHDFINHNPCKETYRKFFGSWEAFIAKVSPNLTLIPAFPKTSKSHRVRKTNTGSIPRIWKKGYRTKKDKEQIRTSILDKLKDKDTVLLLESPGLTTIKQIEESGIKPSKIVIPNNFEFKELATALRAHPSHLKIECVNASALDYLTYSKENFDFVWLDYCGGFSNYTEDLDALFEKQTKSFRLFLTYNVFDPQKTDEDYYLIRPIAHVLNKANGHNKVELITEASTRYKRNMYNLGFDIRAFKEVNANK